MQSYAPYAPPAYPPAFQGDATAADDDDRAILLEAQEAQLAVVDKQEAQRSTDGKFGRGAMAFFGTHTAERVRTYSVRAPDGAAWTYTQPYSAFRQMPGEHSFVLHGAFPQPVQVIPPSNQWRRPRFYMLVGSLTLVLLLFFGLGLLVPVALIFLVPPWAQFKSPDAGLAKWLGAHPLVKSTVRATKFGWLGLLGAGGWRLPWAIQLYSLGDGRSRLVVKAPDVGRHSLTRYRVGFWQASAIARAFQSVMPPGSHAPPQQPLQRPAWA
jgi:hypothetical protein